MLPTLDDRLLDADHDELLRLIEAFATASPDGAGAALDALHAHAQRHFADEDADLRRMKDGNSECHIDEHAAVLASLKEVRALLDDPSREATQNARMHAALAAELRRWLPEHVAEMDRSLAAFRFRERTGGAAVRITRRQDA